MIPIAAASAPPLRVLLVDDDEVTRMLTADALASFQLDVVEASCGTEAIELFASTPPDLVLLDLVMPGMDGFEVCSRLRAMPGGGETPILVMTGLDDGGSIDRAYEVGATDFVTKPVNHVLLGHRLRYLLRAARAFSEARFNTARLACAQRLARLVPWEADLDDRAFRWSEEAELIFQFPVDATDLEGALLRWVHPADRDRVARAFMAATAHTIEYRVVLADGRECVVRQEAVVVPDPKSGRLKLQGTAQDITELRNAERQVHDLAYFDSLTKLPNRTQLRRFLDRTVTDAQRDGRSAAVLALDLDGFKQVNDTLGHAAGDQLLCEVARRLTSCVRSSDTVSWPDVDLASSDADHEVMAARFGGDEFVVVLGEIRRPEDAAVVAQRIADRLAGNYTIDGTEVFISASIGIATFPADAGSAETLLDHADSAMYHAKHTGRNRFQFYTPLIQEAGRARLDVERSLRAALHRLRTGEQAAASEGVGETGFRLVYQPKVEVPSHAVVGVEALLRWCSPELGQLSPADFIPIAEDTGLIIPLGAWVLRTACARAKEWSNAEGSPLRVAVNVSARQFREPGFTALVAEVLAETELDPSLLELELTEGMLMEDTAASKRVLDGLKALGVRIALDDFGTGYSSLSYLARLPIDSLKIDRSFLDGIGGEGRGETIVAAIIALSRCLGIDVVVEGVERADQLAFVSRQGIAEIQGFLFAHPMAPCEIDEWRRDHHLRSSAPDSLSLVA